MRTLEQMMHPKKMALFGAETSLKTTNHDPAPSWLMAIGT
jgi:hypothetical protein